jgi:hypothetical protein
MLEAPPSFPLHSQQALDAFHLIDPLHPLLKIEGKVHPLLELHHFPLLDAPPCLSSAVCCSSLLGDVCPLVFLLAPAPPPNVARRALGPPTPVVGQDPPSPAAG